VPGSDPASGKRLLICDAQVHAPDTPSGVHVPGLDPDDLLHEMAVAGVDRCVVVPLAAAGGDVGANNGAALEVARRYPSRFAVMGRFEVSRPEQVRRLDGWTSQAGMLGLRMSFARPPDDDLFPNVAVKATALPDSVAEPFPFRSLHEPLRQVFEAFGPRRLFWGSDLTRLKVPYSECVRLFTGELPFLTGEDKEWVMGRGVMEWLKWNPPALPS